LRASGASEPKFLYFLVENIYGSVNVNDDRKLETWESQLMIASEQSERADIFVFFSRKYTILLYIFTGKYFFCWFICFVISWYGLVLEYTDKPKTLDKLWNECERAKRASRKFWILLSITYNSSQYFVGKSYTLSVQYVLLFVTLRYMEVLMLMTTENQKLEKVH